MFALETIAYYSYDYTYKVILDKSYTVGEFINCVLENCSGDWGYIGIVEGTKDLDVLYWRTLRVPEHLKCNYLHGVLASVPLPDEVLNRKILAVRADGGWSIMDYRIITE